jgi:5-deoxy-glucuronate isomerase
MNWHKPATAAGASVTPEQAGWEFSGLDVRTLEVGVTIAIELLRDEAVIVPLSARNIDVTIDGEPYRLEGREGVFAAVSDWLYVPVGSKLIISGASGEVAICTARASQRFPVAHIRAEDVSVEVRGAGRATRQVTNIATPESFPGADRINVCEVITPGGNWSSWPPHRHDGLEGCTPNNEEIYYFRLGRGDSIHGEPEGQGLFHVYSVDGSIDDTVTLHDGDLYLVPHGYHGPSVAPPEYPMYFLNVLAGPNQDRTMAFCDDATHHWIREAWEAQEPDPRLPVTSAHGKVVKA